MAWSTRGTLLPADGAENDYFGSGVALSDDGLVMAVGAWMWEGALSDQGGVYIYDWSGSAWVQRGSVLIASDAASTDRFGAAVSLSADGAVLAVGAHQWEGTATNQGGVYIYDWSGSAWVQRGSVLVASDPAFPAGFGRAVALSNDGSVLAVGANNRTGTLTGQGGVYVYDYSGGAWVQRGGVLVAADAGSQDYFGWALALSGTAGVLAVGALYWEGDAGTNRGGVYVYDYSGGAWVQRGAVLTPAGAADSDYFGSGVALSGDGTKLAVGAEGWEGSLADQGAVYLFTWTGSAWAENEILASGTRSYEAFGASVALSGDASILVVGATGAASGATITGGVIVYDAVATATGTPTAPTELTVELSSGTPAAPTALTVELSAGSPTAPTTLTVTWPTGTPVAPTVLYVTAAGTPAAPTRLAVVPSDHVPTWRARCMLDGVDVSTRLKGVVTVTAAEGGARIASLTIAPEAGVIAPLDYVGREIAIDYVLVIGDVDVPRRLFTGRVDVPQYDPSTSLLSLACTDDLQNRVDALDRTVLDDLIGGRYTTAVQGDIDDGWDYAQARLSTVAASLDADAAGGLRVTPWEISTAWRTYGAGDLIYRRCRLTLPQRSTLVNRVDIAFSYRYPRLRQRFAATGWSGTQAEMLKVGYAYPQRQDVLGAASGTGWTPIEATFYPAPSAIRHSSGGVIRPREGSIDLAIIKLTQRHAQTVTESYALTVTAPESVGNNGTLARAMRGALQSEFDGNAWESALDIEPLFSAYGELDHAPDAPRADAEYAIQTLLDQANATILGSHRAARVGNSVILDPDLDLDKRVVISTSEFDASGKVARVVHTMDLESGAALSEFDVAVFGVGGTGLIAPDTLAPPAPPAEAVATHDWGAEVPHLSLAIYGTTPYQESLSGLLLNPPETITVEDVPGEGTVTYDNPWYVAGGYPVTGFRVTMPGVADADRNPLEKAVAQAYQIVIPEDTLTFSVPAYT